MDEQDTPESPSHKNIKTSPRVASRILTLVPKSVPKSTGKSVTYDLPKLADQERFLTNLAVSWHSKLKELKPEIEIARNLFRQMPRGTTLCGCSSFRQFCEEKLHVSRQGVYEMLGDYHAKRKAKKQEQAARLKRHQPPKPAGILDSPRNQEAAMLALSAVAQYRTAKTMEEKTVAWTEYVRIVDEGLQSVIGDDDRPHYMLMLLDLVVVTERLVAAFNALNPTLKNADEPILAAARSCAEQAEKYCGAVRRRLNRPVGHAPMQLLPGKLLENDDVRI
jgi:hypothetical protein